MAGSADALSAFLRLGPAVLSMPGCWEATANMKFKTKLQQAEGMNATGIEVPEKIVAALGSGKRPAVKVTIKTYTYRSTIHVMGGKYLLPVAAEVRKKAGVVAGEAIEVTLELDTEKREVEVPPDLAKALKAEPKAKAFFEGLAFTYRKEHARALTDAKTPETRQRRLDKIMDMMRSGKKA
jgi:hypothetical protein